MEVVEPKRHASRKKPSTVPYPEEIVHQYSRISHLLSHAASRKWILYEWQYNEVDTAFFHKCRTFEMSVAEKFPRLKTRNLTRAEWCVVRRTISQRKRRRFSSKFIHEQRIELEKYRESYCILQENGQSHQLAKLNGSHAAVDRFLATFGSTQSQNQQLFRLIVETKKLLAVKTGLITKLREINMRCLTQQQPQSQNAIVNVNLSVHPSVAMNSGTAIELILKLRDCNKEIMEKLKRLMCLRIVKDTLLIHIAREKNVRMTISSSFFHRISLTQQHESRERYRAESFIVMEGLQTLLDVLLEQIFLAIHSQVNFRVDRSVQGLVDDVINDQMATINTVLPNDLMGTFTNTCLPNFLQVFNAMRDFFS